MIIAFLQEVNKLETQETRMKDKASTQKTMNLKVEKERKQTSMKDELGTQKTVNVNVVKKESKYLKAEKI